MPRRQLEQLYVTACRLRSALESIGGALKAAPDLLPPHYTGFITSDDAFYKPIRDAGLATGKLTPARK